MDVDVEEVDENISNSGSESSELTSLKGIPLLSSQESSRLILDESMPFCSRVVANEPLQIFSHPSKYNKITLPCPLLLRESTAALYFNLIAFSFVATFSFVISSARCG